MAANDDIAEADRAFLRQKGGGQTAIGTATSKPRSVTPQSVEELLERIVNGIPRAIQPLRHRREGAVTLAFSNEYDIQTLFHALLAPWVKDIRPEEYTPSYAGKSRRVDFLLPEHKLVVELKYVRDRTHGRRIGEELIVDIAHYAAHPKCESLWAVVHDPHGCVQNPDGLISDLEGERSDSRGRMNVRVWVLQP